MEIPCRLVAYFYIPKDGIIPPIYQIHFECLNYYKQYITKSTFGLAIDEDTPEEMIQIYRKKIIDIGFKGDIEIKIIPNTIYREGYLYNEEIVQKLTDFKGMTVFIHGKGLTNIRDDTFDNTSRWVMGMYYQIFSIFDTVKAALIDANTPIVYGSFKFSHDYTLTNYKWYYCGSFQVINTCKLYNYIQENKIKVPILCDRAYAETFLGDILPDNIFLVRSFNNMACIEAPIVMHQNVWGVLETIMPAHMEDYNEFEKKIRDNVESN